MIDFTLTEEQTACQRLVREFAQNEIAPTALERDAEQRHDPQIVNKYFGQYDGPILWAVWTNLAGE